VAADLLTQRLIEQEPWDPKRSALFASFGFLYQGCAQYYIVNLGWERLFPGTKPGNVLAKVAGMNFLSDPLLFMPTFYIFRETLVQGVLSLSTAKLALEKYLENCLLDWRNSWLVWLPGHAVTYGIMPPHKRIPWMAFLSFFYMVVLS
jgi:protein Mpv17